MKLKKAFVFSTDSTVAETLCNGANSLAETSAVAVIGTKQVAKTFTAAANKVFWLGEKPEGTIVECYTQSLEHLIRSEEARLVLLGNGTRDRCIAARLAVRLDAAVITDPNSLSVSEQGLEAIRNVYGGTAAASLFSTAKVTIVSLSGGIFERCRPVATGELLEVSVQLEDCGISFLGTVPKEEESVDLSVAKRVVGIGRGLKGAKNLPAVQALAAKLGAELGCTRPIAEEEKLLARSRYIGVSGASIKPDVYFACGISGQVQHTVGIVESKVIIAINKDAKAPIMQNCDYGIVGDMNIIIPQLIELL